MGTPACHTPSVWFPGLREQEPALVVDLVNMDCKYHWSFLVI